MKRFGKNILSGHYMCIDLETTGLDPKEDGSEIIEFYIKIMKNDIIEEEYHMKFWSDNWEKTYNIHKIPKEDLIGKERLKESEEALKLLRELLRRCESPNDDLVLMAHHVPFEFSWLCENTGLDLPKLRYCDTREISKMLYPKDKHNLNLMCRKFNLDIDETTLHRADADVRAMWGLFKKLENEIPTEMLEEYDYQTYINDIKFKIH